MKSALMFLCFMAAPAFAGEVPLFPVSLKVVQACVNPGGNCNGSIPCCAPYQNFCIRGQCRPYPDGDEVVRKISCVAVR